MSLRIYLKSNKREKVSQALNGVQADHTGREGKDTKASLLIKTFSILYQMHRVVTFIYTPKIRSTKLVEGGWDACYHLGGAKASGAVPDWEAWAAGARQGTPHSPAV